MRHRRAKDATLVVASVGLDRKTGKYYSIHGRQVYTYYDTSDFEEAKAIVLVTMRLKGIK